MEATVVDMPGQWSAQAMTMSERLQGAAADDLCTEADVDEISAMEAVLVEEVRIYLQSFFFHVYYCFFFFSLYKMI
jgi:hypothetical protein